MGISQEKIWEIIWAEMLGYLHDNIVGVGGAGELSLSYKVPLMVS